MSAYVYILFDKPDENLIIGVTSNLLMHMHEIKNKISKFHENEFSADKLAYYEKYNELNDAIIRKKELEDIKKEDLVSLITDDNPNWDDMHDKILKMWDDSLKSNNIDKTT